MTTLTTETRPEYMTDEQLQAAYYATLEDCFQLERDAPDQHTADQIDVTTDLLLALATEIQQRYRFAHKPIDGPLPPVPPELD